MCNEGRPVHISNVNCRQWRAVGSQYPTVGLWLAFRSDKLLFWMYHSCQPEPPTPPPSPSILCSNLYRFWSCPPSIALVFIHMNEQGQSYTLHFQDWCKLNLFYVLQIRNKQEQNSCPSQHTLYSTKPTHKPDYATQLLVISSRGSSRYFTTSWPPGGPRESRHSYRWNSGQW